MDNRHFGGPRPLPGCRPSFGDLEFSAAEINELLKRLVKMQDVEGLVSGVNIVNIENHELLQPGNLTLEDLGAARLANMNDVFVPWQGSAYATRNYLPALLRRKGISISYVTDKGIAVKERAVSDVGIDNANWGIDSNWMRVDELSLNGKLYVSPNGTWVINGVDTGIQALGPKGDNGLTPRLKTIDNKLHYSYDGVNWEVTSEHIAAWFRWSGNKIQISRDNKIWEDFSGEFADNLFIKGYVATFDKLPADAVQGDIWGVGPVYAADDAEQTNPRYRYYVRNAGGWVDNGEFTSIAAGIVQETGDGENVVMSQKAVTEKYTELGSKVKNISKEHIDEGDDEIRFEDNDGNFVGKIDTRGADFKNLKKNGDDVVTMREVAHINDKVDNISKHPTSDTTEEQVFSNDDETEVYVRIGSYGVKAKEFLSLDGRPINATETDKIDGYPMQSLPCYPLISGRSKASIFKSYTVIGASFECGCIEYKKQDGATGQITDREHSWGAIFCKDNNALYKNYAIPGCNMKGWCTGVMDNGFDYRVSDPNTYANRGIPALENDTTPTDAYIVNISSNDFQSGKTQYPLGSASEISTTSYDANIAINTHAGYLAAILCKIKEKQPRAYIFVATIRKGSGSVQANEIEKAVALKFENTFVMDMHTYGLDWDNIEFKKRYMIGSHPNYNGHLALADQFNTYIHYVIQSNPIAFRSAQFVGTDYYDKNNY